jgi:membrane protein YdbS with pleckstrin-like domain
MPDRLEIADDAWLRVSPKLIMVELAGAALFAVAGSIVAIALMVLGSPAGLWILIGVLAITVIPAIFIPRRVRSIGYQLRDDDLLFRRGILFQRFVAVPYGRMQLIDINRGPVARLLGLADLKFVTAAASTGVSIPGLTDADATELRDRLVGLAETRRAGL